MMSGVPPGKYGTTKVTGRCGNVVLSACAADADAASAAAHSTNAVLREREFMVAPFGSWVMDTMLGGEWQLVNLNNEN
jgi:hypothetical protein